MPFISLSQCHHLDVVTVGNKKLWWLRVLKCNLTIERKTRLYFCAHHFCPKWKMFTFSQAHSHALTNATRRHEYFRGLSRLLPVPGVLVSFLELCFLGKMSLLALGGHPQPLKKPSQSQKGRFYEKMNALNDTKTSELSKSAKETGNICDRLWHWSRVWI